MVFQKWPQRTPSNIGNVLITLEDNGTDQTVHFEVDVRYSDGTTETTKGDLLPHLTAGQQGQLRAFMAAMRAKAAVELL